MYISLFIEGIIMLEEFKSFPLAARRLIIYYTLASPFLIVYVIFSVYLFKLGFNVEVAGLLYAISALMGIIFTFLIGRALDKALPVKTAMSVIEATFALANFVYAIAISPIHIVLGSFLEKLEECSLFLIKFMKEKLILKKLGKKFMFIIWLYLKLLNSLHFLLSASYLVLFLPLL